jgi:pyruvate dehydrogenase E1 component
MVDRPITNLDWYTDPGPDADAAETSEWLEAFEQVIRADGSGRGIFLLEKLLEKGHQLGVKLPFTANTPYVNTIPREKEPPYPGDLELERRINVICRWNAMAMVVRANREHPGLGGHISSFASSANLNQVAFNHFLRGRGDGGFSGDVVYFQGHAAPGIYARAFLEGAFGEEKLLAFRRELAPGGGLSSYPHPWLMPDFWEVPTVSMGLGPISAIYQARFNHYLADRGMVDTKGRRVWAFLGDGECDEPETLGAISLAAREGLSNLIFVVNCNLQRLDGPVRGNGKIIQELETVFRGAGWNVVKVIWGSDWDDLLSRDRLGLLRRRMNECVDGEYQKYSVETGDYIRRHFFGKSPELEALVSHLSDDQLRHLSRGGHDPRKIHAAFRAAVESEGRPTVVLAKTVKGFGLGDAGEGTNPSHQQKKLTDEQVRRFRDRFDIPVPDSKLAELPFYRPPEDAPEMVYLRERRRALGGFLPRRRVSTVPLATPPLETFREFFEGTNREVSTTMAFVRMLGILLKDPEVGKRIVPIVSDEARTFGMESMFRSVGIYSHVGQLYEPVDKHLLLYYREAKEGQMLEEGITEAGALSSFIAAATSHATHGLDMIPFFIFYSMFGFQRVGDLIWACGDQRGRGFLLGATAGRTTLNGEGLQHEDGQSQLLASTVPILLAYDPAWAYEIAVILEDGLRRMYREREDVFYYLTLYNENMEMPAMPPGSHEGILRGLYRFRPAPDGEGSGRPRIHLLGSGSLLREAMRAQVLLADRFGVDADVWSATSWKGLRTDALDCERWNLLHPGEPRRVPWVEKMLGGDDRPVIAVSDWVKAVPEMVARWLPGRLYPLGTDGFGRSDTREALRRFFEVDAECVALAALSELERRGELPPGSALRALRELGIDPEKPNPARS